MRRFFPRLSKMLKKNKILIIIAGVILVVAAALLLNKFVINKRIDLKKSQAGNINVLLLGIGGGRHEGPDLSDTIIFASINPSKNQAYLISIPRDLWVGDISGKINRAYAIGQEKNKQGLLLSRAVVAKVTGQNINYEVVIDFSGFVTLVDYLGGIDVNVSRTLDDYLYPVEGREEDPCGHTEEEVASLSAQIATSSAQELGAFPCRYKHIHFDVGTIHMNGKQALEFSRSRHGLNGEGSDFARSRRQQEVIAAIKAKALALQIILNPIKVFGIFNILKNNIDTNIQISEFDDFINLAQKMQGAKISSYVIDFGDSGAGRLGLLTQPLPSADRGFQSILIPRVGDGNFSEIHDYVACIVGDHLCEISDDGIIKDPLPPPRK